MITGEIFDRKDKIMWTDREQKFIETRRTAFEWSMIEDVVNDHANGEPNDARRIALYKAALERRSNAPDVTVTDSTPKPRGNGGQTGTGTRSQARTGCTPNQANALRRMAGFIDSLYEQLANLGAWEAQDGKVIDSVSDDRLSSLTRPQIDGLFKAFSANIDRLKGELNSAKRAQKSAKPATPELEAGMYRKGDKIFKVQRAVHGSGNLYAKELVQYDDGFAFEYAPGAIRKLTSADRMTLEQAKAWGALYGTCCQCGKTLTDEKSIENGIGPVCATKF